ncbi:MAG: hypothetical protein ACKERG_04125 [Candidatus Hodgkinia cicadicola]
MQTFVSIYVLRLSISTSVGLWTNLPSTVLILGSGNYKATSATRMELLAGANRACGGSSLERGIVR